jgi:Zn-dependent protease with chaperone function
MALYTGLVKKIKPTDDELAQSLGHEIAHALAKHPAETMSVAMASSIGVVAVGVAADNKELAL